VIDSQGKSKTGGDGATSSNPPVITLLTDFGVADYFVGAMKGAVLSINPKAILVDITHDIPPQDIEAGAFTLLASYLSFPPNTIYLAVVDPGVGSSRKPLIAKTSKGVFVGPDNGLFSYVLDREREFELFNITNDEYFRKPVSNTFHGRDIFAPIAAELSCGLQVEKLGPKVNEFVALPRLEPSRGNQEIKGRILHIDRFGNCITNITREYLSRLERLVIRGRTINTFKEFFAQPDHDGEEFFAIWGSAGFLEIAATNSSAAKLLGAARGDEVTVVDGSF
jgi:S-adenosylmethionine hydrolase